MDIDFLITELNVGGAEKAITHLAIGMHDAGHLVRVLSIDAPPIGEQRALVDRLQQAGVDVQFGGFRRPSQFLAARRWLRKRISERNVDVLQSFLFHAHVLAAASIGRDHVKHFVGGLRVATPSPLRRRVLRWAMRPMDHVVAVSQAIAQQAQAKLHLADQRCTVIPNGVDLARFEQAIPFDWQTLGWPADSQVALFVGRLHPQKGLELLQAQAARLLAAGDKRRLLLVGDGPLRESLQHWIQQINSDDRLRARQSTTGVEAVKRLPWQADIAPLMKAATMLILPSRYEGMPNVVLEAMAAGLPIVCSKIEGAAELFTDAESAPSTQRSSDSQVFPIGDGPQMRHLAETLFADPIAAKELGQRNRQHASQSFSYSLMIQRYQQLYQQLCGR
ncbi:MAG: hypothetical protein CBB71_16865 [Rhodopirellula sp. TMED11]|nr:MAG: hypothetical protein CBB71_16865 [Rhodopirellula sp. TMED11]